MTSSSSSELVTHIIDSSNGISSIDQFTPTSAMHGLALLGSPAIPHAAHRVIINKLTNDIPFHEFELALLQLVHAVVTHKCSRSEECLLSLRSLLCRLCSHSLHFGVKLLWTIEAFSPNAAKSTKSALEGLRELLEAAVVNGTEDSSSSSASNQYGNNNSNDDNNNDNTDTNHQNIRILSMPSSNTPPQLSNNNSFSSSSVTHSANGVLTDEEEALIHIKMGRANILNDQRLFFQQLVGISDFLRKISDRGSRGNQLRLQLLQLSSSVLQRKVFMPFSSSSERPRWIVRILPDEAVVFSSRERAPYLLVVETVTSPQQISKNNSRSNLPSIGFANDHNHNNTSGGGALHSFLPSSLTGRRNSFTGIANAENNHNNSTGGMMMINNNNINNSNNNVSPSPSRKYRRLFQKMCGDPDVREQTYLQQIGLASSTYHIYAKPWNPQKAQPILVYNTNNIATSTNNNNIPATPGASQEGSSSNNTANASATSSSTSSANRSYISDPWRESTNDRRARLRESSPFSHLPGWNVESLVIKAGDDLTQEQLALQVVDLLHRVWQKHDVPVSVLPYQALSVVYDGGVIECIDDAISIDSLKKSAGVQTLHQFFLRVYGEGTPAHSVAQRNFIESMAGYSVVCHLMQVKDRHNANLMLGRSGHLVHIDFGFMFGTSPGNMQFENAPFKMSQELLDTMGGANSEGFRYFKVLLHLAMEAAREEAHQLVQLISVIAPRSGIKCFGTSEAHAKAAVDGLKLRLGMNIGTMYDSANSNNSQFDVEGGNNISLESSYNNNNNNNLQQQAGFLSYTRRVHDDEVAVARYVRELVDGSLCNWRTTRYDQFQTWQNGII